jgi:autotransporter-associated beta strand protein
MLKFFPTKACFLLSASALSAAALSVQAQVTTNWTNTTTSAGWDTTGNWAPSGVPQSNSNIFFNNETIQSVAFINFGTNPAPGGFTVGERAAGAITLNSSHTGNRIIRANNNAGNNGNLTLHGVSTVIGGETVNLLAANYSSGFLAFRDGTSSTMDITLANSGVVHVASSGMVEMTNNRIIESGGARSITLTGGGILRMSTTSGSSPGYSGGTFINHGTLEFGRIGSAGRGTIHLGNASVGQDAALMRYLGGWDMSNSIVVAGGSGSRTIGTTVTSSVNDHRFNGSMTLDGNVTLFTNLVGEANPGLNFNGAITGAGNITVEGTGIVRITANNNDYTGNIEVQNGSTLEIGYSTSVSGSNLTGTLGNGAVTNNGNIRINRDNAWTLGNDISGTGSLVHAGEGTMTLSGANSFIGGLLAEDGEILITGSINGSSGVTVNSGARLGGTGLITAPVSIAGRLAPSDFGVAPTTLTIDGNLLLQSSAVTDFFLSSATQYSRINAVNALTLGGTINVVLQDGFAPAQDDVFVLFGGVSSINSDSFSLATGLNLPSLSEGLAWNTSSFVTDGTLTVIPEPSTYALVIGLGCVLFGLRRRFVSRK